MSKGPFGKRPRNCYAQKGSPYWYYEINLNGKREKGSTNYEDADKAAQFVAVRRAALEAEAKGESVNPVVAAITGEKRKLLQNEFTWGDALDKFHDDCIVGTADERNALRRAAYLLQAIGDKPFHDITHADLFTYRMNRLKTLNRTGQPISPLTANRELAHVRQVFNHMNDLGARMPPNWPNWSRLIDSEAEENAARTRSLSTEEEAALFVAIREHAPHLEPLVEFMLLAGQRKAASVFLEWENIDWQRNCFKVKLKGKGKKKRDHFVSITRRMAEIIKSQPRVEDCPYVFTYVCRRNRYNPDGHGFLRKKGRRYPFSIAGWKRDWAKVLKEAGIEDFHVHDLRHTNATRVVRASKNLSVAQHVLGHKQSSTTARYVHMDLDDQHDGLQAAEDLRAANLEELHRSKFPPLRAVG
jgi:integrase